MEFRFNIGDTVKFKDHFDSSASCCLFEKAGTIGVIVDRAMFYTPAYKLAGDDAWYGQKCFEDKTVTTPVELQNLAQRDEACSPSKNMAKETICDTESSGEPELAASHVEGTRWYRIAFSAKLTGSDLRAMKKCLFDALNESMELCLEIKEED